MSSDPICLLRHENYKVVCSVGLQSTRMHTVKAVLDTGAGPNIVHQKILPPGCQNRLIRTELPHIADANRNRIALVGALDLHVHVGDIHVRSRFLVTSNLAAECILGTSFIGKHVKAILPQRKRVLLQEGRPIALAGATPSIQAKASKMTKLPQQTVSNKVRVAKSTVIQPMTQSEVLVHTRKAGLVFLQGHSRLAQTKLTLMANGVMEVVPDKPFRVWVSNFSASPVRLPKDAVIGLAFPAPRSIYAITSESSTPQAPDSTLAKQTPWEETLDLGEVLPSKRGEVIEMLREFEQMWTGQLGKITATKHRIVTTPSAPPVYQPPYRAGKHARELEKREVQKMLSAGVIEPSNAEWASPVVLVPKPDGSKRFCVDYRKLNALTIRDAYPIPRMDECIDSLGEATIFTTLDANSGYWQIEMAPEDRDKTTFTCHEGIYRFTRMPFGLKNAPATFQRAIDIILSRVKWQYALVYLDDVIIYSKSFEEHIVHVRTVLTLLSKAGISLKLKKCEFFRPSVSYLGHTVRPGKLEVASKTCNAVRQAKPPQTQTELRSFLGLCNVYRRFVPNFARIAAPLNKKLMKDQPTNFETLSAEEYDAFQTLKRRLIEPPILALPKGSKPYRLETDACDHQVGCVLTQEQDDPKDYRPIGYWSRSLTKAEKNYSATERECLAIVWSVLLLRPYLEGAPFVIRTDHDSLRWLLNIADVSGRLARWRLRLSEFDFEVVHRPGSNTKPPTLSQGCRRTERTLRAWTTRYPVSSQSITVIRKRLRR